MKTVLIGEKYVPVLEPALSGYGFSIIPIPDNPAVDGRISGHVDLSLFANNGKLWAAAYLDKNPVLQKLCRYFNTIEIISSKQSPDYPNDCALNIRTCGMDLFYNPKSADRGLVRELLNSGFTGIPVRQGYTACSILNVGIKRLVTQDTGIAAAAVGKGYSVLKINPDSIDLPGFQNGFIGGCGFLSDQNLFMTGMLESLSERNAFERFVSEYGINIIYLTAEPMFDIGGVILCD